MEIFVVVPSHVFWEAFVVNLRDLWEIVKGPGFVDVGPIRYKEVNMAIGEDRYRGYRPKKIILYNCLPSWNWMAYLTSVGTEIEEIWD